MSKCDHKEWRHLSRTHETSCDGCNASFTSEEAHAYVNAHTHDAPGHVMYEWVQAQRNGAGWWDPDGIESKQRVERDMSPEMRLTEHYAKGDIDSREMGEGMRALKGMS